MNIYNLIFRNNSNSSNNFNSLNIKIDKWIPNDELYDLYQNYDFNMLELETCEEQLSSLIKTQNDYLDKLTELDTELKIFILFKKY
jgi:hypothetical protein